MSHNKNDNKTEKILLTHSIAPTPQRLAIGRVLFDAPIHLSAEQVMSRSSTGGNLVSKATVYNTLRLFVDAGLLREVNVDRERLYYDSRTDAHHHIYNVDTGELRDVEFDDVAISAMPELPDGTEAEGVSVVIQVRNQR